MLKAKIDPQLVKELGITNIQPIKKGNGGINGVGNVSCFGFIGKQKVKIFTTYRADLPTLREELETYTFKGPVRFPPLIGTRGRFVVEKWIDGPNLTQIPKDKVVELVPDMVNFLFEFKDIKLNFDSEYNHLQCFRDTVAKRGKHNALIALWDKELQEQTLRGITTDIPKYLRHGDLHEANIVLNGGVQYIVDNDGVSYDNGWFTSWRKSYLYSTKYPQYPVKLMFPNWQELEHNYYDTISFRFMELTQFLRQAFFQRDFIDFSNKKVTLRDIVRRMG